MMKSIFDWDTPPRFDEPELIDDENQPYSDFRSSMKDVQFANSYLGGTSVVTRQVRQWLQASRQNPVFLNRAVTFLDVATGSGDLPKAILRVSQEENVAVRIVGLDFNASILRFAGEEVGAEQNIRLLRGDAFRLPYADASVDYVLCSLAFHHFGFEGSINALREMERVAKLGWLVNDLRRSWSAWILFRVLSTITGMNRMTLHDGPASILRAYSISEYRCIPESIKLREGRDFRIRQSPFYRVALIREKMSSNTF